MMPAWSTFTKKIILREFSDRIATTVGRVLLHEIVPEEIPFSVTNKVMKKKELADLIDEAVPPLR